MNESKVQWLKAYSFERCEKPANLDLFDKIESHETDKYLHFDYWNKENQWCFTKRVRKSVMAQIIPLSDR